MLAHALHMEMAAEIKRQLILLQKLNYLLVIFHGTLGCIHPALFQQIMMSYRKYKLPLLLSKCQLPIHPLKRFRL